MTFVGPNNNFYSNASRLAYHVMYANDVSQGANAPVEVEFPVIYENPGNHILGHTYTLSTTSSTGMHSYVNGQGSPTFSTTLDASSNGSFVFVGNVLILARPNTANQISGIGVSNSTTASSVGSTTNTTVERRCIGINDSGTVLVVSSNGSSVNVVNTGITVGTSGARIDFLFNLDFGFRAIVTDLGTSVSTNTSAMGTFTAFGMGVGGATLAVVNLFKASTASASMVGSKGSYIVSS